MSNTNIVVRDYRGKVIYSSGEYCLLSAVEKAVSNGESLQHADLRGAELRFAGLRGADLRGADLQHADLRGVDLQGANLQGADLGATDLQGARLQGASLQDADLRGANLQGANLQDAGLQGANLQGANLRGVTFPEGFHVVRLDFGVWSVCVYPDKTTVGCRTHPNKDWLKWGPDDVAYMANGAREFWATWGSAVKETIRAAMKRSGRGISLTK